MQIQLGGNFKNMMEPFVTNVVELAVDIKAKDYFT